MNVSARVDTVIGALAQVDGIPSSLASPVEDAVFVGSGDSLSSALLAVRYGHRAISSGDIAFAGRVPRGARTVVGISNSGTSGATVRAVELARTSGLRTVAITADAGSPLASVADEVQVVPRVRVDEAVPCMGHLLLGLGVAAVCGEEVTHAADLLASRLGRLTSVLRPAIDALAHTRPEGISVLSLPDLRAAADFWMLKLIEATGLSVRCVALEESGHVDYFIGPQSHLSFSLVGSLAIDRHERLGRALATTGQTVVPVVVDAEAPADTLDGLLLDLVGAVAGTVLAEAAAHAWGRPPFRGGAVNMDAAHIKLDGHAFS
jgi:hypothetical protein